MIGFAREQNFNWFEWVNGFGHILPPLIISIAFLFFIFFVEFIKIGHFNFPTLVILHFIILFIYFFICLIYILQPDIFASSILSSFPFFSSSPLEFTQTQLHRRLLSGLPNRQPPLSFSLYFYPTATRMVL